MLLIDVVLLLIIAGFVLFGYWFGIIHTLGSLIGTLIGAFVAGKWYLTVAGILQVVTGWDDNTVQVISFAVLFLIVNRLVGFFFWVADRVTRIFQSLPFLRSINRLLGAIIGFFEGAITLGLLLYVIDKIPVHPNFMRALARSEVAPYLLDLAGVLLPLIPEALKQVQSSVDYNANVFQVNGVDVFQATNTQ